MRRCERVTGSQPIMVSRSLRCQEAAHQMSTATISSSSRMNWQSRSPASRPAPRKCSSSSKRWAICQSAGVSAVRIRSEAALDAACGVAVRLTFMTRLIEHFGAPLFSPDFFQGIERDQKIQAKRPTHRPIFPVVRVHDFNRLRPCKSPWKFPMNFHRHPLAILPGSPWRPWQRGRTKKGCSPKSRCGGCLDWNPAGMRGRCFPSTASRPAPR